MTLAFPSPEFDDAVAAVCHGSASEAELRALNQLLRTNGRARDEYLLRIELHARLASEPDLFAGPADEVAHRRSAPLPEMSWQPAVPSGSPQRGGRYRKAMVWTVSLAAGLALMAFGVWNRWFQQSSTAGDRAGPAVAMLTRVVDARWARDAEAPRAGGPLAPGWLRLESGLAQVVFYSGARVVLEGPTQLQLVAAGEAVCLQGRLLVEVPPPARGFRLKTAQLEIVDLGTAFGIHAGPGRAEVHVFRGSVEMHSPSTAGQTLGEGQAAAIQDSAPPRLMPADPAAFAALRDFQQRSLAAAAYRYEQWQFASARLQEDSALVVHLDFEQLSGMDWSLPNRAGGSRLVPEAIVVGCPRAEGRWREKQALEFQSINDRVRLVVPGDFDALTLAVWVRLHGLDQPFNSLFMCDGFAPDTLHWLIRRDGVLGLTVFGATPGQFEILASPPVLAPDQFGAWLHLAVVLDGPGRRAIHYLNGDPVSRHGLKRGPPFQLGPAELGNWSGPTGEPPAPALIRNLRGAMDEFQLFRRALSDAEVRALYSAGKPDL